MQGSNFSKLPLYSEQDMYSLKALQIGGKIERCQERPADGNAIEEDLSNSHTQHTAHTYQQMSSMALSLVEFGCASDIRFNLN